METTIEKTGSSSMKKKNKVHEKQEKILIIADTREIVVLKNYLKSIGYSNLYSSTNPDTIQKVFESINPGLVLINSYIPESDAFNCIKKINSEKDKNIPIILVTDKLSAEDKENAILVGVTDFITKPFVLSEIELKVKNALWLNYGFKYYKEQLNEITKTSTSLIEKKNTELSDVKKELETVKGLKITLLRNFSHEIRTPVCGIAGISELILRERIDDKEKESFMNLLDDSVKRLIQTMDNYIDISKIISGNMEVNFQRVVPYDIVGKCINKFNNGLVRRPIDVFTDIPDDLKNKKFITDPLFLKKIVSHLLSNAVKFTHQGEINISMRINDQGLELEVKDTGIGIAKNKHSEIFDYCQQVQNGTTRKYQGSGLGLPIIQGMLKLLNGKIKLISDIDCGSCFKVFLPGADKISF
ncbi:MAG: hybrid sensor histidine kinase/response regulator [Bacteroidales bacterium]|nr:hybrid sensor histidine kinase/response regulator [Bacteroidales bacterium]